MKPLVISLALTSAFALTSCGDKPEPPAPAPAEPKSALQAVLISEAPADPVSVTEARKTPTPGTEVIVTGDIIGKREVFVDNRAMLTIGDPEKITSCNRIPGDECPNPWDVCCDDPDVIKASIATVQVLDKDGKLIKESLKGLGNMKELSTLVVKGTVAEGSNPDNLVINATGIHIASVEPRQ